MAKKFLTGLTLVNLSSDPSVGSEGELYFNTSASVAKIYKDGGWSELGGGSGITVSTTEPVSPAVGDGWYKNDTGEFYIYDGTYWVEVNGTVSLSQEQVQDYVAPLFTHENHVNASVTYDDELNQLHIDVVSAPTAGFTSTLKHDVRLNGSIAKGQAVYVSSANGTNMVVSKASNASEATSSKTLGLLETGGSNNALVKVVTEGLLAGLNTSTANSEGDPVWLGTDGNLIYGLANKPYAPAHLVFIGIVTRKNSNNGEIFVKVQNGFELREIHDVLISGSVQNNEILAYNSASSLWINQTAGEAGIATTEDLYFYLTSASAALLYQPISVRLFNLTALENVEGFLRTDGGLGFGIDTAEYLTTGNASSTYLTQLDASDLYLTQTDAENTYLTPATSASIYQPLDDDLTAIAALSGSSGFLKKNIFNDWVIDSNTYLTTSDAASTYQPTGNYATIDGAETLTNKTMSSAFVNDVLTFNDGANSSTIDVTGDSLTINAYDDLYLTTTIGDIVLQPDHFVKIYDEYVATQEWVNFQDYLTEASASTTYSTTSHNHTLDSLSNVVITGTPTDGQAIVWDTATSKWVNETVSGGGGASYPDQSGNDGKFLQTNSGSVSWQNVDFTGYLTESSASTTYLTQASASTTYLTTESDTLETVTDRGATSTNAITISNTTQATSATTGALIVSGGVGVAKDLWIDGNLHVAGTTTTENTKTVVTHDNLIYLNAALDSTITNAVFASGSITYTAENLYTAGMDIRITGIDPSGFNISTEDNLTVASATPTYFIVVKSDPGASYVSGGTAHAKEEANPDLGFAGGYYDSGYAHAGLFRDASDGIFKFFKGYTPEPDEAVNIDTGHVSFTLADIMALNATLSGSVSVGSIVSGYWAGTPISYTYGGTGLTTLGTAGQVLKVNSGGTALEWGSAGPSFTDSAGLASIISDETGTGSLVFANTPTLITPNIGVATATSINGTTIPSSVTLTKTSDKLSVFASTTSAELASIITDETGSGSLVFSNSPTLVTPSIGAATGTSLTTTGNVISHTDILTPTFVTNSYTLTIGDDGDILMLNNSTTAGNLLIPTDASVNFPIGTQITIVQQGTGLITVSAVTPATTTLNSTPGAKLRAQWSSASLIKTAANTWLLVGDLTV